MTELFMKAQQIDRDIAACIEQLIDYVVEKPMGLSSLQIDEDEINRRKIAIRKIWKRTFSGYISTILWNNLNKWERLFYMFLDMIEFIIGYDNDGFYLHDLQGANLGDIEDNRFKNAAQIFDRMDAYINDYIFNDLSECADELNIETYDVHVLEDWLSYREAMPNNKFEFDCIDMICNHASKIDLHKVNNYISSL